MSQRIEDFIAAFKKPGPMQEALRKAGKQASNDQIAEIARAHGFDIPVAELIAYATRRPGPDASGHGTENAVELSEEALRQVAGGSFSLGGGTCKVGPDGTVDSSCLSGWLDGFGTGLI
jgi:hypothetical protein